MKKLLKLFLFSSVSIGVISGSTAAVVSCAEFPDETKTNVPAAAVDKALQAIVIIPMGNDGNGYFNLPKWSVENTVLTYGTSANATPPTNFSTTPPINLSLNTTLYVSAQVTDSDKFQLSDKVIPKIVPVTGLNISIDVAATNSAIAALHINVTGNDGNGTYDQSTLNWNIPNTTLQFAISKDGSLPVITSFTNTNLTSIQNGDTLYALAIANTGYYFTAFPTPYKILVKGLSQSISAVSINSALQVVASGTTFNGTLSGATNFTNPAWTVVGATLEYLITDATAPTPTTGWIPISSKPTIGTITSNQVIWFNVAINSGYSVTGGSITPIKTASVGQLNTGISVATINSALNAIKSITTDNKPSGHATLVAPTNYQVTGTNLVYATGNTQPALSTFNNALPTNLSNEDTVWITAKATSGYEISDGTPTIIHYAISGLDEEISFNDVQSYMNVEVDEGTLGIDGLSGEATFIDPTFADHFDYLVFEYKKSNQPDSAYSLSGPTNIANGDTISVRAKLLSGFVWDTAVVIGPIKNVLISGLTNPVLASDINAALSKVQLAATGTVNGQASFNGAPWDTSGNTKISGTELRWTTTLDAVQPTSDADYTRDTLTDLYNGDYIWVKAFVSDDQHEIVGDVQPIHLVVQNLVTHVNASTIQTLLNSLSFTNSMISGVNSGSGTFTKLPWTDESTKLQYGTSTASNIVPTNYQDAVFTNLSNNQYLFVTAIANTGYAIDGAITARSFQITGLKDIVSASSVQPLLDALTITTTGPNGSGTFVAPTWGTGASVGTTIKYAKTTSATTPADNAFTLTTPPTNISNNDYIYIKAFVDSTHTMSGSLTAKQIKVTNLKDSIAAATINSKLATLSVTITGTSGNATFTAPSWTATTGVSGTTLKYGVSADQTTPPNYSAALPLSSSILDGKFLWISVDPDATHSISGNITPKIFPIIFPKTVLVADVNAGLDLITNLAFGNGAHERSKAATFSAPNWSVTGTQLIYATGNSQPADSAYSTTPPIGLSNGDYVWITAKGLTNYNISAVPTAKRFTASGFIASLDLTTIIQNFANAVNNASFKVVTTVSQWQANRDAVMNEIIALIKTQWATQYNEIIDQFPKWSISMEGTVNPPELGKNNFIFSIAANSPGSEEISRTFQFTIHR